MSLYPSLEDMKVEQAIQAQTNHRSDQQMAISMQQQEFAAAGIPPTAGIATPTGSVSSLYPNLEDYMGLNLESSEIRQRAMVPANQPQNQQVAVQRPSQYAGMVAPVSGQSNLGIMRAEIKSGIRMVTVCKDVNGKMGIRIKSVNKGIFVAFVSDNSPCAKVGIRFGDQILQINNETIAGYSTDKVMKILKKANAQKVEMALRDRPFSRTITMQKDSSGHVGFIYKDGKIISLVKDSSAARNGMLVEQNMCEVNGQCVVGMKDKDVGTLLANSPGTLTITIMPSFIYEHIIKSMSMSVLKKYQDHSVPEV